MKKQHLTLIAISLLIIGILFIAGCNQTTNQQTCNKPYILVGTSCCLDQNDNSICDTDETSILPPETNFLTYDNSAYGIRITYPSNWEKEEKSTGMVIVEFFSPKESVSDAITENLNVVIEDLSAQPMTLNEYTNLSIKNIKLYFTDVNMIDSSATTLGGNSAHKVVYTANMGQYNGKFMQVYTIRNNKAYVITYTAQPSTYSYYLDIINQMINSFEII
ncbi:MAG: PsbP-related protein [Candidatus Pacearchaeota archaeon]|nr:PsbP-related protein [Candidatus Pacearchaeota archaeon]